MKDSFDERRLVALALIAVGVLWLLVSSGFIPGRMVGAFWSYWPLLPIGIGLDLLLKQRVVANIPYTALAIALMLLLALLPGTRGSTFEERLNEPIGTAERADVILNLGPAPTTLVPLTGESLLAADIVDNAEVTLTRSGGSEPRVTLERSANRRPFAAPQLRSSWDLGLTVALPLSLTVDGGSGSTSLDLRDIRLESFSYDGGSGSSSVILPRATGAYQADFDLGSGSARIDVANEAELDIRAETGSGSSQWIIGRGARLELLLDSGSGSVEVDLPDDDRILLRVLDDGSGRLTVPSFLVRQEGSGDEGVWRSSATGEPRIVITIEDVGSGSVTLR